MHRLSPIRARRQPQPRSDEAWRPLHMISPSARFSCRANMLRALCMQVPFLRSLPLLLLGIPKLPDRLPVTKPSTIHSKPNLAR